jgi:hypothetical protein
MQLLKDSTIYKSAVVFENTLSSMLQMYDLSSIDRKYTSIDNMYKNSECGEEIIDIVNPMDRAT